MKDTVRPELASLRTSVTSRFSYTLPFPLPFPRWTHVIIEASDSLLFIDDVASMIDMAFWRGRYDT